jgi:hypothetical protein
MGMNTYDIGNTTAYRYYRLDITANNEAPGVAVAELGLWGDSGRTIPNGRYAAASCKSNKVMEASGGGTADGAQIQLWDWVNGNNQKWTVTPAGDGIFKLTAVHSGKLADVSNAKASEGALIHQWGNLNNDNQQWRLALANK